MIDRGKRDVLGIGVNVIDYDAAVENIVLAARQKRAFSVSALAVHGVMTGVLDPEHGYRLNHLDLVTPDGQPVRWALNLLYRERLRDRVNGPELVRRLCQRAAKEKLSVFLFGTPDATLEKLEANLRSEYPGIAIAGSEASRFRQLSEPEQEALNARIRASRADILLVGLGCPRQEVFAFEHAESLSMPVLAVGAAFDFIAGGKPQAPPFMQASGLEWLFRLAHEPRRLWRRYVLLNPLFLYMLARQRLGLLHDLSARQKPPRQSRRYG